LLRLEVLSDRRKIAAALFVRDILCRRIESADFADLLKHSNLFLKSCLFGNFKLKIMFSSRNFELLRLAAFFSANRLQKQKKYYLLLLIRTLVN
jgi:hypothetical protein